MEERSEKYVGDVGHGSGQIGILCTLGGVKLISFAKVYVSLRLWKAQRMYLSVRSPLSPREHFDSDEEI